MANIIGSPISEILVGTSDSDFIGGLDGDDTIDGGLGNDILEGGLGRDVFLFSSRFFGNDFIADFSRGSDRIDISSWNVADLDTLRPYLSVSGNDPINDSEIRINAGGVGQRITLRNINVSAITAEMFIFNINPVALNVIAPNDPMRIQSNSVNDLFGGSGNDVITSNQYGDVLNGGAGDDTLVGFGGDDFYRGGSGNDVFSLGSRGYGQDVIFDFQEGDRIDLTAYNIGDLDTLRPYLVDQGGSGFFLRTEFNGIEAVSFRNLALSALKTDWFVFNTSLVGLNINTGPSISTGFVDWFGGNGDDTLIGGDGFEVLNGGRGNDRLEGRLGGDHYRGGQGNDTFVFGERGFGRDEILDFSLEDKIDVSGLNIGDFETLQFGLQAQGSGVRWTSFFQGVEESFLIGNIQLGTLSANNFIFRASTAALNLSSVGQTRTYLYGGNGNDILTDGGFGTLLSGAGDDILITGADRTFTIGGAGSDTFQIGVRGFQYHTITDFAATDKIDMRAYNFGEFSVFASFLTEFRTATVFRTMFNGVEELIEFRGVTLSQIAAAQVILNTSTNGVSVRATGGLRSDLFGGNGNDTLNGADGNDLLFGGRGNDAMSGGGGSDDMRGGLGLDTLNGGADNDLLDGGDDNDTISGDDGNDTLIGGLGGDALIGGSGIDAASYATAMSGVTASLGGPMLNQGEAAGDVYDGVENLIGSAFADVLSGSGDDNLILGGGGLDAILGANGQDTLDGGSGGDTLDGGGGIDAASYASSLVGLTVFLGGASLNTGDAIGDSYVSIENLIGSAFADVLGGTNDANLIQGGAGNDACYGAGGSDTLEGGLGTDFLDGQDGFDFASYANATSGLTLFMGGGTFNTGEANGDAHISIEGLVGSQFSDIIGGDASTNELRGLDGNDFIYGRGGVDTLLGGDGNDVLDGGFGGDQMDGGAGVDVAYYRDSTTGLSANLLTGVGTGDALGDSYANIENIWGSDFNDVLAGDNNGGQVYGFLGNDNLSGLGGDDFFYGGDGADTIDGGAGVDSSFFLAWQDQTNQFGTLERAEGGDTFTDFTSGTDRIILSRFWFGFGNIGGPAAALTETHANFVTNGTVSTSRPSLIWNAGNRTLSFDADGTGGTAAVLLGTFQAGPTLTLRDIWTA